MALQKVLVPLPMDKGLDTKFDIKQEAPGFLRKAENVVYETLLKLRKRNGYDNLTLDGIDGTVLKLCKLKTELVAITSTGLWTYSEVLTKWQQKGDLYATSTRTTPVIKNASSQSCIDSIIVENCRITVWQDGDTYVRYSVQDLNSQSFIVSNAAVAVGDRPTVGRVANVIYIIYGRVANVCRKSFNITAPATLSAETVIATDRHTTLGLIDCQSSASKLFVSYNGSVNLKLFCIADGGVTSSIIGLSSQSATRALDVFVDNGNRIILSYSNGTDFKVAIYPYTLSAAILAPTVLQASLVVSTCSSIQTTTGYRFYFEVEQAGTSNNYVKQVDMTLAGAVSGLAVFKRSVGLASRIFEYADVIVIPTVYESALQSTYFLLDQYGTIVTKYANQTAAGVLETGVLPTSNIVDDTVHLASLFRNRLREDEGEPTRVFYSTTGISVSVVNFIPESPYSNAELADALHICAGLLKVYDGSTVSEHGFNAFPETLALASTATTGGFMSDGSYGYKAVYRWTDNSGKDHFSAPTASTLEVALSGGGTTQTATITVPTLRLTEKTNVVIDLYRTEDAGTQYYKITSTLSPLANDATVDTLTFIDTLADATLIGRELLYTTGGVIENISAPAAYQVCTYGGNRLAIIGEDLSRVFLSKETTEGTPVEWTDLFYRNVDQAGGPLTAIAPIGEKLAVFSAGSCFYIAGQGPNNLGQQDFFSEPEIIAADIGCTSPSSLVLIPTGLMFKSRKGIYHLSGGLALEYTGARVEAYNGETITGATIVGALNQVRFLLSESTALVYNYNLDRWATFENHGGLSSVAIEDEYYYLREDGAIYQENRTSYSDAGSPIKMRIETAWLSFVTLQGFQRAYKAMLLGDYKSEHKLRVKVAYDFKEAWIQEALIDPTDFVSAPAYGAESPYGSGTPYGGSGALYQARLDFKQQKCESMRLSIEDSQADAGEGLSLSAITLWVGAKEGANPTAAGSSFGTA